MKSIQNILPIVITLVTLQLLFSSCNTSFPITKRHYRDGYFVAKSNIKVSFKKKQVINTTLYDSVTNSPCSRQHQYTVQLKESKKSDTPFIVKGIKKTEEQHSLKKQNIKPLKYNSKETSHANYKQNLSQKSISKIKYKTIPLSKYLIQKMIHPRNDSNDNLLAILSTLLVCFLLLGILTPILGTNVSIAIVLFLVVLGLLNYVGINPLGFLFEYKYSQLNLFTKIFVWTALLATLVYISIFLIQTYGIIVFGSLLLMALLYIVGVILVCWLLYLLIKWAIPD